MRLNEEYPRTLTDGRGACHFKAPFDTVLFMQEALNCEQLSPDDKVRLCVRLCFGRRLWSMAKKRRRLAALFDLLAGDKPQKAEPKQPIMDFEQDAAMIRSAFKQQYGVDLEQERGRMSWWEFIERLSAITPDTMYGRVLQIRCAPVPKPTPENREARMRLIQQKAKFAIRKKAAGADAMDQMWSNIAEMLIEKAKAGENNAGRTD